MDPIPIDLTGAHNSLPEQGELDSGHVLNINDDVAVQNDITKDVPPPDDPQAYDFDANIVLPNVVDNLRTAMYLNLLTTSRTSTMVWQELASAELINMHGTKFEFESCFDRLPADNGYMYFGERLFWPMAITRDPIFNNTC